MFETKGLEHQRHLVGGRFEQGFDIALQLCTADVAGVDDMGVLANVAQQLALGVTAARFGKTAHQGSGGGIQKHHMQVQPRGFEALQLLQLARQIGQAGGAARVNRNRHALAVVGVLQAHKVFQQLGRQVVHAVVTGVFQGVQSHGFARA